MRRPIVDFRLAGGPLITPDESIQLGFDHAPAAPDSLGPDFTLFNILEICRAGNSEIAAGFRCAENGAIINRIRIGIGAPVIAVAPIGQLAPVIAPALI
jgi:hypothetical protein